MTSNDHITLSSVAMMRRYNLWLVSRFLPYLGKRTLEIGAGIGTLASLYGSRTKPTLTDVNRGYLKFLKSSFPYQVQYFDAGKKIPSTLKHNSFDTVIRSNVLEHINDDRRALSNIYTILKRGGKVLLFVPAGKAIYGEIDKQLDHFRRYDIGEITSKAIQAGFRVKKVRHYNFIGFFSWWLNSRVLSRSYIDPVSASLFDRFITPLLYVEDLLPNLPLGQSIFLVAQKP